MQAKVVFAVVLVVVLVSVGVWYKHHVPTVDSLEVVKHFSTLALPMYTPLSGGHMPGTEDNKAFLTLRNDRYVVMIVEVPAQVLLDLEWDDQGEPIYPEFKLMVQDGPTLRAKRVTGWPRSKSYRRAGDFADPDSWFPSDDAKPNEAFRLGIVWHTIKRHVPTPCKLQMNDEEPIDVPEDVFDFMFKWD